MRRRNWPELFRQIPATELDKLAVLRVLECSNGMIQLRFREGHADALNAQDTRRAMRFSMHCIKTMQIRLGEETIGFENATEALLHEIRSLYVNGIKRNNTASRTEFFLASSANLKAIGSERLERARRRLFNDCYELPVHTLDWGMTYINDFLSSASQVQAGGDSIQRAEEHNAN